MTTNTPLGKLLLAKLGSLCKLGSAENITPTPSAGPFITTPGKPSMPASVTAPKERPVTVYTPADLHEPEPAHAQMLRETARRHAALLDAIKAAPQFDPFRGPQPL